MLLDETLDNYREARVFIFEMTDNLRRTKPALWQFYNVYEKIVLTAIEGARIDEAMGNEFMTLLRHETLKFVTLAMSSDDVYELFKCLTEIEKSITSWTETFQSKNPFFIDTKKAAEWVAGKAKLN